MRPIRLDLAALLPDHFFPLLPIVPLVPLAPLAVLVLLVPSILLADDGVFRGTGGAVIASSSDSVQMSDEEVVLDLTERGVVHGTCTFVFTNTGAPESLLVGFPDIGTDYGSVPGALTSKPSISDLRVAIDGEEVVATLMPMAKAGGISRVGPAKTVGRFDWVHTWPCVFGAKQTRILRTEYRHPISTAVWDPCILNYVLSTGASWAGPIGKAVVRVLPGRLRLKRADCPRDWTWTGTEYVWTRENFKPDFEVELSLEDPAEYAALVAANWRGKASSILTEPYGTGGLLSGCGPIERDDFLQAVCSQFDDSLAEVCAHLREIYASEKSHGR